MGTVAAGIAHEIDNPLGIITHSLYDIKKKVHDARIVGSLRDIEDEINAIFSTVEDLRSFTRKSGDPADVIDVNEARRSLIGFIEHYFRDSRIRIFTPCSDRL